MPYRGPQIRREAHIADPFGSALRAGFAAYDDQIERDRRSRAETRATEAHRAAMKSAELSQAGMGEQLERAGVREGERPGFVGDGGAMGFVTNAVAADRFRMLPGVEGYYLDRNETPDAIAQQRKKSADATREAANRARYDGLPSDVKALIGGYAPGMDVDKAVSEAYDLIPRREEEAGRNYRFMAGQEGEDRRLSAREAGEDRRQSARFNFQREQESRIPLSADQALDQARAMLEEDGVLSAPPAVVQALAEALMRGEPADKAITRVIDVDEFGGQSMGWGRLDRAAQPPQGDLGLRPRREAGDTLGLIQGRMPTAPSPDSAAAPTPQYPRMMLPGEAQLGRFDIAAPAGMPTPTPRDIEMAQSDPVFRDYLKRRGYTITEGEPTSRYR